MDRYCCANESIGIWLRQRAKPTGANYAQAHKSDLLTVKSANSLSDEHRAKDKALNEKNCTEAIDNDKIYTQPATSSASCMSFGRQPFTHASVTSFRQ